VAEGYPTGGLSISEMKRLVSADAVTIDWSQRSPHPRRAVGLDFNRAAFAWFRFA
jgi:hypothetical protein